MSIEWDKIEAAPTKSHKIEGTELLNMRSRITELENIQNELNGKIKTLESDLGQKNDQVTLLNNKISKLNEVVDALEKSLSDKDESMGNIMNMHANFMKEIEKLNEELTKKKKELTEQQDKTAEFEKTTSDLKYKTSELEKQNLELKTQLTSMQSNNQTLEQKNIELQKTISESQEKVSSLDSKSSEIQTSISQLKEEVQTKETVLKEKETQITNLNNKIASMSKEIADLKDQIPKKHVIEKADEVIKGTACPLCSMTTYEEYKIIGDKKQLIRKWCLNSNCGWSYQETPRKEISVELEGEVPQVKMAIRLFEVTKEGMEEVSALNSQMVAIVADPFQDIIWIWRGEDSDRFIYAEATREVGKVKNDIMKLSRARIERIEEGNEPDNFKVSN